MLDLLHVQEQPPQKGNQALCSNLRCAFAQRCKEHRCREHNLCSNNDLHAMQQATVETLYLLQKEFYSSVLPLNSSRLHTMLHAWQET